MGGVRAVIDEHLLAQVVQVSADAIYTEDLDGVVTSWNAAAERLYGHGADDVLGRPADLVRPERYRAELREARERAVAGERVDRFDTVHERDDGTFVPVSLTLSPLTGPEGAVSGVATSVQDISERTRLLADLEHAHRALERQQEVLLRSNRDLEQFAYVASHDLSEPLRVVSGYVDLLTRRYGEAFDERGQRYVQHVLDGCQRMRDLIDDLLEYSRFLRVERDVEVVDTAAVAGEVVERLQAQVDDAQATVHLGDLPSVIGDRGAVAAMLQNLVGNAIKFRRPGAHPRVEVSAVRDGGHVVLRVDDDGIGIAPEFREKVFRMFQRLHVREEYGGTGIGLAVVQKVAEHSGGRVWIEESPLGGARFCVSLPAAAGPPPAAEEAPS